MTYAGDPIAQHFGFINFWVFGPMQAAIALISLLGTFPSRGTIAHGIPEMAMTIKVWRLDVATATHVMQTAFVVIGIGLVLYKWE